TTVEAGTPRVRSYRTRKPGGFGRPPRRASGGPGEGWRHDLQGSSQGRDRHGSWGLSVVSSQLSVVSLQSSVLSLQLFIPCLAFGLLVNPPGLLGWFTDN